MVKEESFENNNVENLKRSSSIQHEIYGYLSVRYVADTPIRKKKSDPLARSSWSISLVPS